MENVIFDSDDCILRVQSIGIEQHSFYGALFGITLAVFNNNADKASFHFNNGITSKILYYTRQKEIADCLSQTELELPAECCKAVLLYYAVKQIQDGDFFDLDCSISIGDILHSELRFVKCPRFRFSFRNGIWSVSAVQVFKPEDKTYEKFKDLSVELNLPKSGITGNLEVIDKPFEALDSLVGLSEVKEDIITLTNFIKIQNLRRERGLKAQSISHHLVFTGNPGTGKTTVARIVASIYRELGILKKGHCIETDRAGLVAGYVGHTALKTNKIIDSALDGVLFIDEAYSLTLMNSEQDFGPEAVSTLLKRMEDDRERLVVIVAGYPDEMEKFINSNPGLKSRFTRYIHFPDYSCDELLEIFRRLATNDGYTIERDALLLLEKNLSVIHDKEFGNGRGIRNIFEKSVQMQANRLSSLPEVSNEDLATITVEDIQRVLKI